MSNTIQCPNCSHEIDVQDVLSHKLEHEIRQKYIHENALKEKAYLEKEAQIEAERKKLQEEKTKQEQLFQSELKKAIADREAKLKAELVKSIQEEQEEAYQKMQEELNVKNEQLKELNKKSAEIEQLKREKANAVEEAKLAAQKEINAQIEIEKEKLLKRQEAQTEEIKEQMAKQLKEQLSLEHETALKTLQKQLEDQKRLTEEMKRKQEQGSMQLQGEALELIVEDFLNSQFPYDHIDEIKKGANGADCLQMIHTDEFKNCGSILYETKNAQKFSKDWIDKLKKDVQSKKANIGVLVTKVYPKEISRMALIDGVWVCSYQEFKGLSIALRQGIIEVARVQKKNENKGDKMEFLYDYLTSQEFKMKMTSILDAFNSMKSQIETEKRAFHKQWKEREAQLETVITNTMGMYGSIKGIAQSPKMAIEGLEQDKFLEE